jgi:hypothetical protein
MVDVQKPDNDPWKRANELHAIERTKYMAMKAAASDRRPHPRIRELEVEWRAAHRMWWEEVDRVMTQLQSSIEILPYGTGIVRCRKPKTGAIEKLGMSTYSMGKLVQQLCLTRDELIVEIDVKKRLIQTLWTDKETGDQKSADVYVTKNGYLRTTPDEIEEDNLGELEECIDC